MFAFVCDYADHSSGKLTAVGIGFDTIYARQVPARHPIMYGVLGMRFSVVEVGPKKLGVRIIDADGNNIVPPIDGNVNVDPPPAGYTNRTLRVALGIHGLEFPRFGDYSVSFLVEGQEVARVPLKVAPPPSLPTTA
jgi:hypothetical protein